MAKTIYKIELTEEEQQLLQTVIDEGKEPDRTILRAKIILLSDAKQDPKYTLVGLARELGTTSTTVQTTRTEYGKGGLEAAVFRKKRVVENGGYKFTNEVLEQIIQLAESEPPEGHKRWTTRLLSKECMERGIVDYIAPPYMSELLKRAGKSLTES
jgi:hypothetical protein